MNSFTTAFTVDQPPDEVFAAILNVRGWWIGDIDGDTEKIGDQFTYRYEDLHRSTQQVTELVPARRVVWRVVDSHLAFVSDKTEWNGTDVTFDIAAQGDQTEVRFTHVGLVPDGECFDSCSNAWSVYINSSLRSLITTGVSVPTE
jgi:hypothetical protein